MSIILWNRLSKIPLFSPSKKSYSRTDINIIVNHCDMWMIPLLNIAMVMINIMVKRIVKLLWSILFLWSILLLLLLIKNSKQKFWMRLNWLCNSGSESKGQIIKNFPREAKNESYFRKLTVSANAVGFFVQRNRRFSYKEAETRFLRKGNAFSKCWNREEEIHSANAEIKNRKYIL